MRFNAARKSNMAESDDEVGLVDVKVTIQAFIIFFSAKICIE